MKTSFIKDGYRCGILCSLVIGTCLALAQTHPFKPGDKIEYRESKTSEVWELGTYVGATPGETQPIIRKKPNEFYKDGAQTAYDWNDIRPLTPGAGKAATKTVPAPASAPARTAAEPQTEPDAAPLSKGNLLTQQDILAFLEQKLGNDPFGNPKREQIHQELAGIIKARGLAFRYENLSDFSNKLGKYGVTSVVIFPLGDNYGPPTPRPWLAGVWGLSKIGATVDYAKDGYIYRQTEIGVKDVGKLTISGDHKYSWQTGTPAGVVRGEWRAATAAEMKTQGGDGLVLLKAKGGEDWIVMQDRTAQIKGEWVKIAQLNARQIREWGARETKGK